MMKILKPVKPSNLFSGGVSFVDVKIWPTSLLWLTRLLEKKKKKIKKTWGFHQSLGFFGAANRDNLSILKSIV